MKLRSAHLTLLLTSLFLISASSALAQWTKNGINLPEDNGHIGPLIRYSSFHDTYYVLSMKNDASGLYRLDSMKIDQSEWGIVDTVFTDRNFIATNSGELVFGGVANGNLTLNGFDGSGQFLWTSTTTGLALSGAGADKIGMYESPNGDIYLSYEEVGISLTFRYSNGTWTNIGAARGPLEFLGNGSPVSMEYVDDTTSGFENRIYRFDSFNGTNWLPLDSAFLVGIYNPNAYFGVSKLDSIYVLQGRFDDAVSGNPIDTIQVINVRNGQAFQIGNGFNPIASEPSINRSLRMDSLGNPHIFYHICDLGWNAFFHHSVSIANQVVSNSQTVYFGHPIETSIAYSTVVDELNCIEFAFAYHSDLFQNNGTDTIKVEVRELCSCDYLNSLDIQLSNVDNLLESNISIPVDYQWIDCATFQPIAGETNPSFSPSQNGSFALATSYNVCADTTTCMEVTTISISEESKIEILIKPNPISSTVTIAGPGVFQLQITDISGQVVSNYVVNEFRIVDLTELVDGVYFFKVSNDNWQQSHRVLKL